MNHTNDAPPPPSKPKLKECYKNARTIGPIYTGGAIALSPDAQTLYSTIDDEVVALDVSTGEPKLRITPNSDFITCMAVQPDGHALVVATRTLHLVVLDTATGTKRNTWKGHEAPVLVMDIDRDSSVVATGSADSTVKVWDIAGAYCSHNFKGHSGVVSAIKFNAADLTLVSGGEDGSIRIWDLFKRQCVATLNNHVSVVRGLAFLGNGRTLVSASRDKVLCVWDLDTYKPKRVIPVYEALEAVQTAGPSHPNHVLCAGEKGAVHLVDTGVVSGNPVMSVAVASAGHTITHVLSASDNLDSVAAVTSDHSIVFLDAARNYARSKQIIGYNDEVIDLVYTGIEHQFLAVATNSSEIKLFNTANHDSEIFTGHDGVVFCLAGSKDGRWLVSGSKDKTAKLWHVSVDDKDRPVLQDVGTLTGHTEAVGAIAMSSRSGNFVVTGSQDRTMKIWDVQSVMAGSPDLKSSIVVRAKVTVKAHEKDINSVAISPNDRVVATASQDKLVKLWSSDTGTLLGELKGHRRGVWRCAFSPSEQVLATSSGDKTIKLWNIKDHTCIRTFEGHTHSVLNVMFVSYGTQLVSSGSDGLVKLWTIRTNTCVATMDAHEDRVWALAAASEMEVVSGGADSVIQVWRDSTVEDQEARLVVEQDMLIKDQDLSNYLAKKDYKNAILLALSLDKPYRILKIMEEVMRNRVDEDSISGSSTMDAVIGSLPLQQVGQLLQFIRDWNTHAKSSTAAQVMLRIILETYPLDAIMCVPEIRTLADAILIYSERHISRLDRWVTDSYLLDYTVHAMDGLWPAAVEEGEDENEECVLGKRKRISVCNEAG